MEVGLTKFYSLFLKSDRETDVLPKEIFSQKCPGGRTFQLISAHLGKGSGAKVVIIQGLTDRGCPNECEKKWARHTYFCKRAATDVCPLA
jgi:hypothetical protein